MDPAELEETFQRAAEAVKSVKNLPNSKLLDLYGLYKLATVGACNVSRPGMLDFAGRAKWDAWNSLGDLGRHEAMQQYIELVESISSWKRDDQEAKPESHQNSEHDVYTSQPGDGGLSMSVSIMEREQDIFVKDEDKTVFQFAEEGNITQILDRINSGKVDVNDVDEQGATLLHWASDRGHIDLVTNLLDVGAIIESEDQDAATALHYAVLADREDVIKILVSRGASITHQDIDDQSPYDVASEPIQKIMVDEFDKRNGVGSSKWVLAMDEERTEEGTS
ncbi:hypothetical protein SmJEL517_g03189 [Synchytrium microbalum]|uniref:ACB domain-containing protein n=1 Tax=Synchytrium microbalum TaxID=1806994 RepID=A0A507C7R9_9FUNG|nr:uncharacterized protein SmJEL517_g03189 [Synchytrium microbalum]TPX34036.1 hypothetical protein SmJEL517_g03189 [Synchytrium microbalum]